MNKSLLVLNGVLFGCCLASSVSAQEQAQPQSQLPVHKKSPFPTQNFPNSARLFFASAWGVDKLKVSYTSSGNLIRFSYRVSEPERAKLLSDKSATPYLMEPKSRAVLSVPVMDKVGALRQTAPPKLGQEYWMVFSNKGNLVHPGDRVNVQIGNFHADGLVVE
jgi:hypothetical protein